MTRLKQIVKLTNRLDRTIGLFATHLSLAVSDMSKLQGDLDRFLYDRRKTIDEATERFSSVTHDFNE